MNTDEQAKQSLLHGSSQAERSNAISYLYSKYHKKLVSYLKRRLPPHVDGEDIVQEMWLKLLQGNLPWFNDKMSIGRCLYRLVRNEHSKEYSRVKYKQEQRNKTLRRRAVSGTLHLYETDKPSTKEYKLSEVDKALMTDDEWRFYCRPYPEKKFSPLKGERKDNAPGVALYGPDNKPLIGRSHGKFFSY